MDQTKKGGIVESRDARLGGQGGDEGIEVLNANESSKLVLVQIV